MILGTIRPGERRVRITERITCTKCMRQAPGGIVISESNYQGGEFRRMIAEFKASYLCGSCRDAVRVARSRTPEGAG